MGSFKLGASECIKTRQVQGVANGRGMGRGCPPPQPTRGFGGAPPNPLVDWEGGHPLPIPLPSTPLAAILLLKEIYGNAKTSFCWSETGLVTRPKSQTTSPLVTHLGLQAIAANSALLSARIVVIVATPASPHLALDALVKVDVMHI